MNPLQSRLAGLRRRLRTVVTVRGGCLALAALVGSVALACLIDQAVYLKSNRDLPALIRAVFLVGVLGGTGSIAHRFLLRPLRVRTDDLALALRVEEQYPVLNDSLASTVQFLEQSGQTPGVSPALQRETVQRALRLAAGCDFNKAVDARGTRPAFAALLGAAALVVPLLLWNPGLAMTALARLADPFGGHRWPGHLPQTALEITYPQRIGFGQKFVIRGQVSGAVPDKATIEFNGLSPSPQAFRIDKASGKLIAPIDMTQQRHDFRFRVRAGDAVSPPEEGAWHKVELRHPPTLAALGGKPSPQVTLLYPAYTDLPSPHSLSPGSGNIEGVAGTFVLLKGAANRPVARVWVEHRPTAPGVVEASYLAPLGARHLGPALALFAGGNAVWGRTYGTVYADGKLFDVNFQPWTKGTYVLVLEDAEGLTGAYEYDENIVADPLPRVAFVRPAASQSVLPNAEIRVDVRADDEVYAVRSVYLEYRRKNKDGVFLDSGPSRVPLYDEQAAATVLPQVLAGFARMSAPAVGPSPHLRPRRMEVGRRWSLEGLAEEGDTLLVQACAHDFNDVVAFNVPGRSPVIELRVVGKTQFRNQIDDAQAQLEQAIVRVREMQEKAIKKVVPAEQQWRTTGKLPPESVVDVAEAEQLQKQVQERIGLKPDEGLRGEVKRLRDSLRDNKLPHAGAEERLKAIGDELKRLTREHLPEIEPRLTNARRELENKPDAKPPAPKERGDLGRAREHQEEVRRSLDDLLKYLENWADMQQVRGEMRKLLEQQRQLQEETAKLELDTRKANEGKPQNPDAPPKMTADQEAKLRTLAAEQRDLAREAQKVLDKMQRLAEERAVKDPKAAEKLQKAAEIGQENQLGAELKDTGKQLHDPNGEIKRPQFNRAIAQQEESIKTMQQMLEALEEGRDAEVERLLQKQQDEGKNLKKMTDQLERLRKKAKEATTKEERKKLAEEQRQLEEEVEKKARELARLQAPQAGKALNQAAEKMERAAKQLDAGEDADEAQKQASEQLQEAQKKLEQAQERTEEELARERLARIADHIKGLKDRQDASLAETTRLHKAMLQKSNWSKALLLSLEDNAKTQQGLAKETTGLKEKLKGAPVFELILDKTVKAMEGAREKMQQRKEGALKRPLKEALEKEELAGEEKLQEKTVKLQKEASRRLERLMDAIKPEPGVAQRPKKKDEGKQDGDKGPKQDPKNAKKGGIQGDGIPPLAQLKALRAEQQEVNDRTREFAEQHPNEANLGPNEQAELNTIRSDQERLFELFSKMSAAAKAAPAGGENP